MGQYGLGDAAVFVGEGPARAEADQYAAGADGDLGGGFDQALAPGAGEAFPQRVVLASAVEPCVTIPSGEGFGRDAAIQVGQVDLDRSRGGSSQTDEQIQGGGVQVTVERSCPVPFGNTRQGGTWVVCVKCLSPTTRCSSGVGQEPMVAQAIRRQFALEFLVAVLALAGHRRFGGPVYSS